MALNLEEQEQLDELKAFWKQHGLWISAVVILSLGAYVAWNGYQYWQQRESEKASALFTQFIQAADAKTLDRVQRSANNLADQYGTAFYARQAALEAAKLLYEANQSEAAQKHLQWLASQEDRYGLVDIARLRLASLLLEAQAYADALDVLQAVQAAAYQPLAQAVKGDVYAAQSKPAEAITAYQTAGIGFQAGQPYRSLIELKLDALGAGLRSE